MTPMFIVELKKCGHAQSQLGCVGGHMNDTTATSCKQRWEYCALPKHQLGQQLSALKRVLAFKGGVHSMTLSKPDFLGNIGHCSFNKRTSCACLMSHVKKGQHRKKWWAPGMWILLFCDVWYINHRLNIYEYIYIWVCLKIGYIPNEIAISKRDHDQQNHWVHSGFSQHFQTHPIWKSWMPWWYLMIHFMSHGRPNSDCTAGRA